MKFKTTTKTRTPLLCTEELISFFVGTYLNMVETVFVTQQCTTIMIVDAGLVNIIIVP